MPSLQGCAFCLFTPPHKPISYKVPDTPSFVLLILLKSVFMRCLPGGEGRASHWLEHELSLILWSSKLPKLDQKLPACSRRSFLTAKSDQTNCSTAVTGAPSSRSSSSPPTSTSWFSETCNSLKPSSILLNESQAYDFYGGVLIYIEELILKIEI